MSLQILASSHWALGKTKAIPGIAVTTCASKLNAVFNRAGQRLGL